MRGRVQGVGFRAATFDEGRRLGLRGWVRNCPDGSVEVVAQGDDAALAELEAFLRQGPRPARVTAVDVHWEPPSPDLLAFGVR